ncbi:UDP-galactose transporter [Colletotrichum orchidophilum]|uniref:UDP-galactose transporter n=1 Tax=Colletotrichum orchidophilum TaxID=1209926 RepID=A0A1G4BGD2_9PEZI|nr:UDP-galactose transporter [Colletotrichum orchidophilum]OHF00415.1 UDP-galactose transporter [Colletotrichum orchidophilum]
MAGVIVLVQVGSLPPSFSDMRIGDAGKDTSLGIVSMLIAGYRSAFAGVYMEAALKSSERSVMFRNAQLVAYGCLCSVGGFFWQSDFSIEGFFRGHTMLVWDFVLLQAMGGFPRFLGSPCIEHPCEDLYPELGFPVSLTIHLLSLPHALSFEVRRQGS